MGEQMAEGPWQGEGQPPSPRGGEGRGQVGRSADGELGQ